LTKYENATFFVLLADALTSSQGWLEHKKENGQTPLQTSNDCSQLLKNWRTPMRIVPTREPYEKLNIVRDPTAAIRWRATVPPECMLCGWDGAYDLGSGKHLETHHIAGAAGRSDEPEDFLLVCAGADDGCHEACTANKIKLGDVLAAKQLCDPSNYNRERVMILKGFSKDALTDD
jgi:hypothetical protein